MGNRSEEKTNKWVELLDVYGLLGLRDRTSETDEVTFFVIPGKWTPAEFRELLAAAA